MQSLNELIKRILSFCKSYNSVRVTIVNAFWQNNSLRTVSSEIDFRRTRKDEIRFVCIIDYKLEVKLEIDFGRWEPIER